MAFTANILRVPFSKQEDKKLADLVSLLGENNWNEIAESLPGRNPRQCRDRWMKHLSPNINLSPFTEEEDAKLLKLRERFGPKWTVLVKYFDHRTDNSLKSRYKKLLRQKKKQEEAKSEADLEQKKEISAIKENSEKVDDMIMEVFGDCEKILDGGEFFNFI
ncbi:RNA polymerase II transcription regulator recruiting protein [Trichomonas vaginalis G3]|uniref:RNA polymerase II transcription regulator recruiting protein n=1 Tax=Trichomonas vaginalis (strain ATCC PRA-98 / G3) TaxID=412133 RepID=UPI0021E62421|nr:RNA polymerase II transcription regulator recruiting protein [Trichomonas vaginalis G3]KAI5508044.1 RNA polymerase II transcription regulator recruiting protein [Trichomonas vaginalis G3]